MWRDPLRSWVLMSSAMSAAGWQSWATLLIRAKGLVFSQSLWEVTVDRKRAYHWTGVGLLVHTRTCIQKYHPYRNNKHISEYDSKQNIEIIENIIASWIASRIANGMGISLLVFEHELFHNMKLTHLSIEPSFSIAWTRKRIAELQNGSPTSVILGWVLHTV